MIFENNDFKVDDRGFFVKNPHKRFIPFSEIGEIRIAKSKNVKYPIRTVFFGIFLIFGVHLLVPIQKFSIPKFGYVEDVKGGLIVLIFYLIILFFGFWTISKGIMKRPIMNIFFLNGEFVQIPFRAVVDSKQVNAFKSKLNKFKPDLKVRDELG